MRIYARKGKAFNLFPQLCTLFFLHLVALAFCTKRYKVYIMFVLTPCFLLMLVNYWNTISLRILRMYKPSLIPTDGSCHSERSEESVNISNTFIKRTLSDSSLRSE